MVVETAKLSSALDALIRCAATSANHSYSALMRGAIVRGLEKFEAIDMHVALAAFISAGEALGTFRRIKTISVITAANARVEPSFRVALCGRRPDRVKIPPAKFSPPSLSSRNPRGLNRSRSS